MIEVENLEKTFDNKFTREFGFPKKRPATKVKSSLSDKEKEFIQQSPFLGNGHERRRWQLRRIA